jgi:hypothetical protein
MSCSLPCKSYKWEYSYCESRVHDLDQCKFCQKEVAILKEATILELREVSIHCKSKCSNCRFKNYYKENLYMQLNYRHKTKLFHVVYTNEDSSRKKDLCINHPSNVKYSDQKTKYFSFIIKERILSKKVFYKVPKIFVFYIKVLQKFGLPKESQSTIFFGLLDELILTIKFLLLRLIIY